MVTYSTWQNGLAVEINYDWNETEPDKVDGACEDDDVESSTYSRIGCEVKKDFLKEYCEMVCYLVSESQFPFSWNRNGFSNSVHGSYSCELRSSNRDGSTD